MSYSRRELYAMGEPLGECVTRKEGGRIIYGGGGGGGTPAPTSQTITQSNIPDWLRPQVETLLGGATQQLFTTKPQAPIYDETGKQTNVGQYDVTGVKPYTPYSAHPEDYVAGFSPLQEQVQRNVANLQMPGQYAQATDLANAAGMGGMQSAQQALGYGNAGFQSGQLGQNIGMQGGQFYGGMGADYGAQAAGMAPQAQRYGNRAANIGEMALQAQDYGSMVGQQAQDYARQAAMAGQQYARQATNPYAVQQYMSPYQQNVIDVQNKEAQRQADIAAQARGASAARAGAFGGARQAIENAEAQRNLATLQNANQAAGLQNAYQQAMQNMQYGAGLGLQGLSGAQQGLGTALQGGQLGLSGIGQAIAGQQAGLQGLSTANQLYGTGIQGAQAGLAGVDRALAGTAQGMQGAQVGLQGVSGAQAGYGLANQAGTNLANIGNQQLAAQTGILGLQNQIGAQQQQNQQDIINNAINNYAQAQNYPMQQMNQYNALLRGYAMPGQTATQYQAAPSMTSQLTGLGVTGLAANKLFSQKTGGYVKKNLERADGLDTLGMYNAMKGAA